MPTAKALREALITKIETSRKTSYGKNELLLFIKEVSLELIEKEMSEKCQTLET